MIKAISFDFWDTLAIDDSDEPKRKALGLKPKKEARKEIFLSPFQDVSENLSAMSLENAYEEMRAHFKKTWHNEARTLTVSDRFAFLEQALKTRAPKTQVAEAITALEDMEVRIAPDPVEGAIAGVKRLSGKYRLGIISDTIVTPGSGIRQILKDWGILDCFQAWSFSDELGHSKPHPAVFKNIVSQLGVSAGELCHVGDRYEKDLLGAQSVGAMGVYFQACVDRGPTPNDNTPLCKSFVELETLIKDLST